MIPARTPVLSRLWQRCLRPSKPIWPGQGQGGAFKLWLGGYSRGSIIANLLAAKIARELPQLGRENIYAYGFAVPAAPDCRRPT